MANGASGIPMVGREVEYATDLWLDGGAFWLHPEGPLSDTSREDWLAKQNKRTADAWGALQGLANSSFAARHNHMASLLNAQAAYGAQLNGLQNYASRPFSFLGVW